LVLFGQFECRLQLIFELPIHGIEDTRPVERDQHAATALFKYNSFEVSHKDSRSIHHEFKTFKSFNRFKPSKNPGWIVSSFLNGLNDWNALNGLNQRRDYSRRFALGPNGSG